MMMSMTIGLPRRRRAPYPGWIRCAVLLGLLLALTAPAVATDTDVVAPPDDGVDTLLQAFPEGVTPAQLDAMLAVMDDRLGRHCASAS